MGRGRPAGTHTKQLTEPERERVRTLFFEGCRTQRDIEKITGFHRSQIKRAIRDGSAVKQRSGAPPKMTPEQEQQLIAFVTSGKRFRFMSWLKLALTFLGGIFGVYTVRSTLRRHGFKRYVARKKPPLSDEAKRRRKAWAEQHQHWTIEQWSQILWTDETWITGGRHRKAYVTRRADEAHHEDCILEKRQRKQGWMFWGCFSGATGKGPCLFWEKDWGTITSETYRAHTVPLIDGWIRLCRRDSRRNLVLIQDGAKAHSCYDTREDLQDRGVFIIDWPPYSPDLNPIEAVWNKMKDYIEENYWYDENPSYDRLRRYVREAWDSITEDYLRELLATMPQRCQDVIAAEGGATHW